jgi:hypothetical protein
MVGEPQAGIPSGRCGHRARRGRWGGVAIVVVAGWGLWQPGSAAATAGVTLHYTCTAGVSMTAQVTWHLPPEIVVGKSNPAVGITAAATISATRTALLGIVGVASIDGSGGAAAVAVAPEGPVDTALHLVVSPTPVPASGPMTFHAAGTLSDPVFREPGHAVVDVGPALDLTLTPRDANGSPVVGPAAVSCTLNRGQDPKLFSFEIMPAPPASLSPTTRRVSLPPVPAAAGTPGGGPSGPGTASAGGARSSTGGSSAADPAVSTSAPPTTLTPTSTRGAGGLVRESAGVSNRRRRSADWWLPVAGTMAVVVGAVGVVRWLRFRRHAPGRSRPVPDDL